MKILASQFADAKHVGGKTKVSTRRTATGIKDTFQTYFLDKLFVISTKKGRRKEQKEADLAIYCAGLPPAVQMISPVWRIKGMSPRTPNHIFKANVPMNLNRL